MEAAAISLTRLYDTLNKAYVIPIYQRPFAWEPQKATELLDSILEDSITDAKLTSLGTLLFCDVPTGAGHHPFGNNTPQSDAPNMIWEIVDGQQRLTVLAIVGFTLKKRLEKLESEGLQYTPPTEFELLFSNSRRKTGRNVPVLIRDEDNYDIGYKSDLARLLDAFCGNREFPDGVGDRLMGAYHSINKWVEERLDKSTFGQFCDYLLQKCQVIQVVADDQDTAFTMFEPLNSTSEPLTAFEVYRSKVIRQDLQPQPNFEQTFKLLDYDNAKRDEVIRRSNTLIFTVAQTYNGERPKQSFLPLKQYLDKHVSTEFVDTLESGAHFFRSVWYCGSSLSFPFDDETKSCIRFLQASKHEIVLPLLVRYFQADHDSVPKVVKIVTAFYSLWRPALATNRLPGMYRELFKTAASSESDNMTILSSSLKSPQELAAYFRTKLQEKLGTPVEGQTPDEYWLSDLNQRYLNYNDLKTICRLFIFLDIGQSIKFNLVDDDPWTTLDDVEHIFPAGSSNPPSSVHKVGNLTFLPSTINKSIQNMGWTKKREVYKLLADSQKQAVPTTQFSDGSPLPEAVRLYLEKPDCPALSHLQTLVENTEWGEEQISNRSSKILKNVWRILYDNWLHPKP